jgi:uncharacterized protein
MLPTDSQIEELHRKYSKTDADYDLIYQHCQIVDAIATQILVTKPSLQVDRALLHVGCMLHDIGAYLVLEDGRFVQGVRHGTIGEEILRNEGFDEVIQRLASHHTGVGLTIQDVIDQNLPIPVADYTAETDEERLVMYADKFHSKSNPPTEPPYFCTYEWFRVSIQKFGEDKAAKLDHLAMQFGKPDLVTLSKWFGHQIKDV